MKRLKQIDDVYEDQETLRMIRDYELGHFVPISNRKALIQVMRRAAERFIKTHPEIYRKKRKKIVSIGDRIKMEKIFKRTRDGIREMIRASTE